MDRFRIKIFPLTGRGIETTHTSSASNEEAISRGREIWKNTYVGYKKHLKIYDSNESLIFEHSDILNDVS